MIHGEEVVHEMALAAPPAEVFEMFVDAGKLVRWLGITADVEAHPGGRFRFEVAPGQFCEGEFVTVEPPRRVEFTWGWSDPDMGVRPGSSTVEVTLEPDDPDGRRTRLRLVHRALPDDARGRRLHDDGWARFLARLEAVVAGGPAPQYPGEQPDQRLEQLREAGEHGG